MGTFGSRSMLAGMLLVAVAVALFVAVGTAGRDRAYTSEAGGSQEDPPPPPPGHQPDGSFDINEAPDCVLVGGNDGKPVMKDGEPLCIPKEELFEDEPPGLPAWADAPEEIDFMNRVNSEIAEERLEGDSPNSNGDDDTSADPPGSPTGHGASFEVAATAVKEGKDPISEGRVGGSSEP